MSFKQAILNEIKKILNEQGYEAPDSTMGIGMRVPAEHKEFLKKLWDKTRPYDNTPFSGMLKSLDTQLRKGDTTDQVYDRLFKIFPATLELKPSKPTSFSYSQGAASATGKAPAQAAQTARAALAKRATRSAPKKYFVCRISEETEAVKAFQKSKGLVKDGKIGKNTYSAILADPSVTSGEVPFSKKGITFEELLGLKDPKMKSINQSSVCQALGNTAAAWITGGGVERVNKGITGTYDPKVLKLKCPSFMKQASPYSHEELETYVANLLPGGDYQKNLDNLLTPKIANTVAVAIKRTGGTTCTGVLDFIKASIKTKGQSIPGLNKVATAEQDKQLSTKDFLDQARVYARAGVPLKDIESKETRDAAIKYGIYNPESPNYIPKESVNESKNWADKVRESAASSLLERLTKEATKKRVI